MGTDISGVNNYPNDNNYDINKNNSGRMPSDEKQDLADCLSRGNSPIKFNDALKALIESDDLSNDLFSDYLASPYKRDKKLGFDINDSFQFEYDEDPDITTKTANNSINGSVELNIPDKRFAAEFFAGYNYKKDYNNTNNENECHFNGLMKYQPKEDGFRLGLGVSGSKYNNEGDGSYKIEMGGITKEGYELKRTTTANINIDSETGEKITVKNSSTLLTFIKDWNPAQESNNNVSSCGNDASGLDVGIEIKNNFLEDRLGLNANYTFDLKEPLKIKNDNVKLNLSLGEHFGQANPNDANQTYYGESTLELDYSKTTSSISTAANATLNYEMSNITFCDFSPEHTLSGKANLGIANKSFNLTFGGDFVKTAGCTTNNLNVTAGYQASDRVKVSLKANSNSVSSDEGKLHNNNSVTLGVSIKM